MQPPHTPLREPLADTGVRVCVIGTGYVGLTLAACLASLGHDVIATDASATRIEKLMAGEVPIVEPGLPELVGQMRAQGRLSFGLDNTRAVADAQFVFLCLPTPQGEGGQADLSRVYHVAAEIGPHLRSGAVVIDKSTVPVGTAEVVTATLRRSDVAVVSNPEFLAEGTALADFFEPDRVVIGANDPAAGRAVAGLYAALDTTMLLTDWASAELIKYAANAFLATKLSFVNSLASICEVTGADIRSVTRGLGTDHRVGTAFLSPGPGWGGSCFPKDTAALVHTAASHGFDFDLLQAAIDANDAARTSIVTKVVRAAGGSVNRRTVAILGLSFKAGTDDLRDSPALDIAAELTRLGAHVRGYDPTVERDLPGIDVAEDALTACTDADVVLIGTEWPQFAGLDLAAMASVMRGQVIVDSRNVLDAELAGRHGLGYIGMGVTATDTTGTQAHSEQAVVR